MHTHANGLQLTVSEAYRVRTTPVGFVMEPVSPSNDDRRDPLTVSIQLLETPPRDRGYGVRSLKGRDLRYTVIRSEEGGSSGWEWTVEAFEAVGDHWILYREHKLSEDEPDELWEIARGVRYVPSK